MARSFVVAFYNYNGAGNGKVWTDVDGTLTYSGAFTAVNASQCWYSENSLFLIVAASAGLRAYSVDSLTGLPDMTAPAFSLDLSPFPAGYVAWSDNKRRIVYSQNDSVNFFTFSESTGFASEGVVDISAFNVGQFSVAKFAKNSDSLVLVVSADRKSVV